MAAVAAVRMEESHVGDSEGQQICQALAHPYVNCMCHMAVWAFLLPYIMFSSVHSFSTSAGKRQVNCPTIT